VDFSPAVYEHAARLIQRSPWEVSRDDNLLFQAHAAAYRLYEHSPIVVGIDIYNLEAEAYGAIIEPPAGDDIPAIGKPVCQSIDDLMGLAHFDPEKAARIPMIIKAGRKLKQEFPQTDVRVPVSGLFSIASNLLGIEPLLMASVMEPERVLRALMHLSAGQVNFYRCILENGLGISLFESAAAPPLISPATFRKIALPPLVAMMNQIRKMTVDPISCIIGGDTAPLVELMMEIGTGYVICPFETDQGLFMRKIERYPEVIVRINIDPNLLIRGDMGMLYAEADRVIALSKNRANVCIGTGVVPFETDPEVILKLKQYVLAK